MLRHFALASVLLIASSSAPAMAVAQQAPLSVTATVVSTCIIATTALTFGNYTASVNSDVNATVITTCTAGVASKVTFDQGQYPGTGSTPDAPVRRLKSALTNDYLNYNLYMEATRVNIWGNTDPTSKTIPASAIGLPQTTIIYGRIPSNQTGAPIGAYTDTVLATVTY